MKTDVVALEALDRRVGELVALLVAVKSTGSHLRSVLALPQDYQNAERLTKARERHEIAVAAWRSHVLRQVDIPALRADTATLWFSTDRRLRSIACREALEALAELA